MIKLIKSRNMNCQRNQ